MSGLVPSRAVFSDRARFYRACERAGRLVGASAGGEDRGHELAQQAIDVDRLFDPDDVARAVRTFEPVPTW